MSKRLIVNADDLGHPAGTVEAVATAFEAGVVASSSAMVNQPDWTRAAAYLRDHPDLGAGVHLVMNRGRPVLPPERVRTLVDGAGRFRDGARLLLRFATLRVDELAAEWRAQIDRFVADTGRQPDHLDLHCRLPYSVPSWFNVTLALAREYGCLPVRQPFDDALEHKASVMAAGGVLPAWLIRWQGRRYRAMVDEHGLRRPNFFEASFSLGASDERRTAEYLLTLLDALPEGVTELLTHPGTKGWREKDSCALLDPRVKQRIDDLGIELITFRDL
jgi:predicted glycoside hydrolase/deacetylase ChbG (UPF0249 family)